MSAKTKGKIHTVMYRHPKTGESYNMFTIKFITIAYCRIYFLS
jgi:hypothetical protein